MAAEPLIGDSSLYCGARNSQRIIEPKCNVVVVTHKLFADKCCHFMVVVVVLVSGHR